MHMPAATTTMTIRHNWPQTVHPDMKIVLLQRTRLT